jgi:hypothetical protein
MNADDDGDLRARFRSLRDQDHAHAPAFDAVLKSASARPHRTLRVRALVASGFAAACVAGLVVFLRAWSPVPATEAVRLPGWPHQTAVLLAGTSDPWQGVAWPASPTSTLGRPMPVHRQENK